MVEVGDYVRIIKDLTRHGIAIGDVVQVTIVKSMSKTSYIADYEEGTVEVKRLNLTEYRFDRILCPEDYVVVRYPRSSVMRAIRGEK